MIRLATIADAAQLEALNIAFNGAGETTLDAIRASLLHNTREFVVVDEEAGVLTGFVCVQKKRSFCYARETAEVTEVYVREAYRRRGKASAMLAFAEAQCPDIGHFELLTGKTNRAAQRLYASLGYAEDGETHLCKDFERGEDT